MFGRRKIFKLKKEYFIKLQEYKDALEKEEKLNAEYISELTRINKLLKQQNEKLKNLKAKYEDLYTYLTPKRKELFDKKHK